MILRVSHCLHLRSSKVLFSFSQFWPQIVQLLAFLPNNGQIAAKLNPGRTKRRLTRLAEGAKRAGGQNGQEANSAGGQSSMSDGLLSCLTAAKWATKKMKPERKAPAFERNPDRLRALGNPLRFSRTLANYETVNLAKIVISVLQYIHCRTVENFTRLNISCNSFIKRTRRLNTLFIGFELAL